MRVRLTIPGVPVPLQRSRTARGRHYLPRRSRNYRDLVQSEWMAAGRPSLGTAPFTASARFYGANARADLDNLVKAVLDALNGLAFADDSGPRVELDLWKATTAPIERRMSSRDRVVK
jgi:Holliday junction resolvase RusA-like endonuclease